MNSTYHVIQQWFETEKTALVQSLRGAAAEPATPSNAQEVIARVQQSIQPDNFPSFDSVAPLRDFLVGGFRCYAMNDVVQLLADNGNLSAEMYGKTAQKLQDFCLVHCFQGFLVTKKFDVKQENLPLKIREWLATSYLHNFMEWDIAHECENGTLVEDFSPRYIIPPEVKYISSAILSCEDQIRHVPAKLYKSIERINLMNWQGEGFPVAVTNNTMLKHLEIRFKASQSFTVPSSLSQLVNLKSLTFHGGTILESTF